MHINTLYTYGIRIVSNVPNNLAPESKKHTLSEGEVLVSPCVDIECALCLIMNIMPRSS